MITAAALCPGPPLLARELTGADSVVPDLREACRLVPGERTYHVLLAASIVAGASAQEDDR